MYVAKSHHEQRGFTKPLCHIHTHIHTFQAFLLLTLDEALVGPSLGALLVKHPPYLLDKILKCAYVWMYVA